jgi:hypothetical protein
MLILVDDRACKGAGGEAVARRPVRSSPLSGRRLPSADWFHGPSPKLPPLTSFVVVKQWATVSSRSVLRTRAMKPASSGAPSLLALHSLPTHAFAATTMLCWGEKIEVTDEARERSHARQSLQSFPPNQSGRCCAAGEGMGWGRFLRRRRRSVSGVARASALRRLTHRHCLTTTNEVSGGSLAMHPRSRSSSWSWRPLGRRPPRHEPPAHSLTRRAAPYQDHRTI